jgi:hypothetical protein
VDKKTTGIIATVVTSLLCGCPGLFLCLGGALTAAGVGTYTTEILGTNSAGRTPPLYGFGGLCLGIVLIAIPIVVGVLTLRNKPAAKADEVPPAS